MNAQTIAIAPPLSQVNGEIELFFPDLAAVPPRARRTELLEGQERSRYLASWHTRFQRGLVGWLKQPGDAQSLQTMRAAIDALDHIGDQLATPVGLWWVAAGLIDLLAHTDAQAERTALHPLLARLERLMRAVGEGNAGHGDELMREMLYAIALAAPVCARVCDIKRVYKLDAQIARALREPGDAQLTPLVLDEAAELLMRISTELERWRRRPAATEPARAMARALHTLKGSVRMTGAHRAGELIHGLESRLVTAAEDGAADEAFFHEVAGELDRIAQALEALEAAGTARAAEATASMPSAMPLSLDGSSAPLRSAPVPLQIEAETLARLVEQAGEIAIVRSRIENELEGVRQSTHDLTDSVARLRALLRETQIEADSRMQSRSGPQAGEQGRDALGFDPLELDRYTRLQELTRMLAESLHDVLITQRALVANTAETEAALALQARVTSSLQRELVGLGNLPFDALRERLQRTLDQTAAALGRKAELRIEDDAIELERSLLHRLAAPLEHLLRNAVAHGIEEPGLRSIRGKPATGRVDLQLRCQGLELELAVSDDGAGLDRARIRDAAVALGLIAEAENLSDAALHELIFAPGLSTALELSESSGRGIGLDAARSEIAALGGRIEVASTPGAGTSFRMRLPLAAASAQMLLLQVAATLYAIPSDLVEGIQELAPATLQQAHADGIVTLGAASYPLYRLARLLGDEEDAGPAGRDNGVVLLRRGEQRMALHVGLVLRNQDAVLKPLGPQLARVPGLAGLTVLGSNRIVLVIDPFKCVSGSRSGQLRTRLAASSRAAPQVDPPHVMVVDDSITVRRLTGRLLSRAGYDVSLAKDGIDALQQMQHAVPDLVVIDLEMPRMDGFELTRRLRAEPRTAHVPIVVVTSRLAEKHQRRAAELGARAYFGKPYPEDELLACIAQLLGARSAAQAA